MQESKTRSEKRSQLPGASVPQKAKFSLDDPLALPFAPWAPVRTAAACQLLDQGGHSPFHSSRRRPICRDTKIQLGKEQFLFGLWPRRCPPHRQPGLFAQCVLYLFLLEYQSRAEERSGYRRAESNHTANPQP